MNLWKIRVRAVAVVGGAALVGGVLITVPSQARTVGASDAARAPAAAHATGALAKPAVSRVPRGLAGPVDTSPPPAVRPAVDGASYAAMKGAADRTRASAKPRQIKPLAPPTVVGNNFNGTTQPVACGCLPPDTHGTVGVSHYVQIVNSRIVMYSKSTNAIVKQVSLNSFFGYTGAESNLLFDPRAVFDPVWKRYVLTAEGDLEADNQQYLFIGVSKTANPTGAFWIYKILVNDNPNVFFDYPQLGMDADTVLVTANVFGLANGLGTPYFFKKSALYNGLGFTYWSFSGLAQSTLSPSIVLDSNPVTFEVSAPTSGSAIRKFGFKDTDRDPPVLTQNVDIPVAAYSVPPSARQPGTTATLDTLDSRFVNAGTQVGDRLFQTHTVALGGFPAPKFYELNTTSNTVVQSGFYFASGTSDDWNASIAANANREVFVTWSSTDSPAGVRPQMRVSGKQPADTSIQAGVATVTSGSVYTTGNPQRWGDYSSVSLDPVGVTGCAANRRAWGTNETVIAGPTWGTRISRFGFC
ncbi:MAG: hypothetical protein H0V07_04175 [Propionibacteriales bacterium]|nr:hypothetical protein [Propionibacteriales bacterium]